MGTTGGVGGGVGVGGGGGIDGGVVGVLPVKPAKLNALVERTSLRALPMLWGEVDPVSPPTAAPELVPVQSQ